MEYIKVFMKYESMDMPVVYFYEVNVNDEFYRSIADALKDFSVGEFDIIEYQKTETVKHFTDSYYYHEVGCYYGSGEPIEEIKDNYREIFWDMVLYTINRLKTEIGELGIRTTEDCIIFHCDHDESKEDREKKISMTVDSETMKKLNILEVLQKK